MARKPHDTGQRGAAKKEAFHRQAEARIQRFQLDESTAPGATKHYKSDKGAQGTKGAIDLAALGSCQARVQVLKKGDKKRGLHYHPNMDQIYMVLKGRVRIYGPGDAVEGDLGPMEGIAYPENSRYWMEPVGDEETWLMQISSFPKGRAAARAIDLDPSAKSASRTRSPKASTA
jgi:mannose-6-phosphate isomerase-like protein (cupin superfamily)